MSIAITIIATSVLLAFCGTALAAGDTLAGKFEGELDAFLGEPQFDMQELFKGERLPNVVVANDGAVLAVWGWGHVRVRRSEDGGVTWGPEIAVDRGLNAGGAVVDENTGHVLVFTEEKHPPAPLHVFRSADHGRTWTEQEVVVHPDEKGNVPSMCMNERGITLRHGEHKGRLLRPARWYGGEPRRDFVAEHYTHAIYSDDGGKTWHTSAPLPDRGMGEGAVAELSNGHIYYSTRKHFFVDGEFCHERRFAWSYDGGATWQDLGQSPVLPDGPRYRGARRGFNYNGHFGMMGGLVRLPVEGRDIMVYSNADTPDHNRVRMTVWASFDGARTWPVKRLVYDGPAAYSSLAAGRPGTPSEGWIYLQFEGGPSGPHSDAQLARFNLSWLLQGEKTGDGEVPEWVSESAQ